MTQFWNKDYERTIKWNDNYLAIEWPPNDITNPISGKDLNAPTFQELKERDLF